VTRAEEWNIDERYVDALGKTQRAAPRTIDTLIAAMQGRSDGRDRSNPGAFADVVVVRGEDEVRGLRPPKSGLLTLEDGEQRRLAAGARCRLPLGYHDFLVDGAERPIRLIGCPPACHLPAPFRIWGWAVQLYALRSRESWGIGDLADLRRFGRWAAREGASALMVNPLAASPSALPIEPSPYFPSSRRFRNALYLRIEELPGAADLGEDLTRLAGWGRGLNARRRIERDAVFALKMDALERCFARFGENGDDEQFAAFKTEQGRALTEFATYCALSEVHGRDWRAWPENLRRPGDAAVARFAAERARRVGFHAWVQGQLDRQLAAAAGEIGLVQDLPVGLDPGGADAWCWQDVLASGISVGAPPDEYNPAGQDWGLVPFDPHRLRAAGYEPFIETIRATARHATGLRIDHVMGLFRLYWIPRGMTAGEGAYVRTRADELLAILALESQRSRTFVVGEDLGTVEAGVREKMADHRMLSFRALLFDPDAAALPELALATVSTHDLPTIAGLWTGADLARAQAAGVAQNDEGMRRMRDGLAGAAGVSLQADLSEIIEGLHVSLGRAPSHVRLATLDDALGVEERPNLPGASADWPNWAMALPASLEEIEQHAGVRAVVQAFRGASPARPDPFDADD
jgi:4-alpha-glucanotransferase